jgi:hypothetical protein
MAVQNKSDNNNISFVHAGTGRILDNEIFMQDAGRTTDIAQYTVVAYDAANAKWRPLTNVTATTSLNRPMGIVLNSLEAADIVAGDVAGNLVLVGGNIVCAEDMITLENSLTLNSVVTIDAMTIEDVLRMRGIYLTDAQSDTAAQA